MQEKRKYTRKPSAEFLRVFDLNTGENMGNVVNLSLGGMMLMTHRDIEVNSIHQFMLDIPGEGGSSGQLVFGGEILWVDGSAKFPGKWAGIQIIDISEEMEARLDDFMGAVF